MEPDAQLAPRVLIAVADALFRRAASVGVRTHGFSTSATTDPTAALTLVDSFLPDVVVVDVEMFLPDGRSLLDAIRQRSESYILAIAPNGADDLRTRALKAGADDAVSMPLHPDELAARCQALLRRPRQLHTRWDPMHATLITIGPVVVDIGRRELYVNGVEVTITRIEFALFEQLCRKPSEVLTRHNLLDAVWGPGWVGETHVVDVHLSNLRRKLQQHLPMLRFVQTVRGVGFRISNDLLESGELRQAM